ncbi:MAG TPA: phosphoribosyl-AMP cyclohydrolase [Alphaproteobacteria bacterium]|nr:phosphoribosyl-AMP cyclohydrolase [Alphaproteobacteria bacterium]
MADIPFAARQSAAQVEEGTEFAPKFDEHGLIPCVTTDAATGELLMHAYMNAEALRQSIALGEAVYYSRSRQQLWHKGATSGHVQKVVEMRVDCDQDTIWLRVDTQGKASCHVGYRSCFFRSVPLGEGEKVLRFEEQEKTFDPKEVYGHAPKA